MSTSTPIAPPPASTPLDSGDGDADRGRLTFVESILDNLSAWTVIASAVGLLYLVWATIEILSRYLGHMPSVAP